MKRTQTINALGAVAMMVVWSMAASAQTSQTNDFIFNVGQTIPDDNPLGLTLATDLTIEGATSISSLTVSLDITGGFNGDLYAYLVGPTGGYAVLLNRSGVGSGNTFGYSDAGFQVTFDDTAANSIHLYQSAPGGYSINGSGQLTGVWQPDGETLDPGSAPSLFDAQTRIALLSSFSNTDPNGTWKLFIADLSGGGQGTLANWKLHIITVPEPSALALTGLGLAGACVCRLRRK